MARSKTVVRVVYNKLPEIAARIPDAALEIITDTLADIDKTVKVGMGAGGSGRTYGDHTASAPGQMPAVDTDQLRGSLKPHLEKRITTGYYYTETDYAPHLEYGTTEMAARPYLTPAAEEARPKFEREFRNLEKYL